MNSRGIIAAVAGAFSIVMVLAGCTAAAVTAPASSASSTPTGAVVAPAPTPSPTPTVTWQDAQALIMLPNATTSASLPHGPSWVSQDGTMMCGIYDDAKQYFEATSDLYYGCRIKYGANRFIYPPAPYEGEIGGCPSGFAANGGEAATVLCNSGQVFSSETGGATVLMPGNGVRFDGIECVASTTGMACTETATGHGFRVTLDDFTLN